MRWIGIDVGGANLKFAALTLAANQSDGQSTLEQAAAERAIPPVVVTGSHGESLELVYELNQQVDFPIWKDRQQLPQQLARFASQLNPCDRVGITMTAELADCFESKRAGVRYIVEQCTRLLAQQQPRFYSVDGQFRSGSEAIADWQVVAASNWHASASCAYGWLELARDSTEVNTPNAGFLFDVGSTTTDVIPVVDSRPVVENQTDLMRLTNGQLCYAGVGRTPVCALLSQIELAHGSVATARELFATTRDALIWLGDVPESADCATADGRSASRANCAQRLGRMVCADIEELAAGDIDRIARQVKSKLVEVISSSFEKVVQQHPDVPRNVITIGEGKWLADSVLQQVDQQSQPQRGTAFTKFELPWIELRSKERASNSSLPVSTTRLQTAPALAVAQLLAAQTTCHQR